VPVTREPERNAKVAGRQGSHAVLALLSLIGGAASGLLGAVFRLALEQADRFRDAVLAWAHGEEVPEDQGVGVIFREDPMWRPT
jgi:CIC family chloride channel protein